MRQEKQNVTKIDDTDMELISLLIAISVTSKRLASKMLKLAQTNYSRKGERRNYETVRNQSRNV